MPHGSQHDPYDSNSDEEDEDYAPLDENKDDSSSELSDGEGNANAPEEVNLTPAAVDEEEKKRAREALWASFQASAAAGSSKYPHGKSPQPRMVKIERKYRFAGEYVIDVIEVSEDSAEATKWPLWKDPAVQLEEEKTDVPTTASIPPLTEQAQKLPSSGVTEKTSTASSSSTPILNTSATSTLPVPGPSGVPKPPTKRPGPRKPKATLAPVPGPTKPKKLTTLDKSAMDWQRHIQTEQQAGSSIKDELDANRRGGGFLEKVEFLKRVEERKEENLDAMKSNKRRRL